MLCQVSIMQKYAWDSEREANGRINTIPVLLHDGREIPFFCRHAVYRVDSRASCSMTRRSSRRTTNPRLEFDADAK
jgi:hypothetical protein